MIYGLITQLPVHSLLNAELNVSLLFLVINENCRDYATNDMCIKWKSKGHCKNSEYAQSQCLRTCRKCKQGLLCLFTFSFSLWTDQEILRLFVNVESFRSNFLS